MNSPAPQPSTAGETIKPPEVLLRELAGRVVSGGAPAISVAWSIDGRSADVALGVDAIGETASATARDHVRIGSITKTYVATLALLMEEAGEVDLDRSIEQYLPGLVPGGSTISLRMLLNHTSGLFDYAELPAVFDIYRDDPGHVWRPEELIALATKQPPYFAPGAGWHYANTNYAIIGLLLGAIAHQPLDELLDARLFQPLDLSDTSYATTNVLPAPAMHGYITNPHGDLADVTAIDPSEGGAAGAIVSTPTEVRRFLELLLNGRVLRPASLAEMQTVVHVDGDDLIEAYGLGLYQLDAGCGPIWGHDGEIFGYMSFAYASPDGRRTLAATTSLPGDPWWLRPAIESVFCGGT
jgi:D-alanyl-D-alanine carboxypeptidase